MIVIPDEGKLELLGKCLCVALVTDDTYSLRVFRNDYSPAAGSVLASFTEASFEGYYRRDLSRILWGAPVIVGGVARTVYSIDPLAWTCTDAGQTVFGYYVVSPLSGRVAWGERFAVPRVLTLGSVLEITAVFTAKGSL